MQDSISIEPENIQEIFQKIKEKQPLIHMIPNAVSASLCADGLSALGARPLMAVAPQEMEEIVSQAEGIVVNLGQLTVEKREAAYIALKTAVREEKPVVLDPVGCGASAFRLYTVQELLEIPWKGILKGNQSEVYSIQQKTLTKEGIDSRKDREVSAMTTQGRILLVSGASDQILWKGGNKKLWKKKPRKYNIVGTGCLLGALAGACHSVTDTPEKAAQAAAIGMMYALEQADKAVGYGQAKMTLLDTLEQLEESSFLEWMKGKEQ